MSSSMFELEDQLLEDLRRLVVNADAEAHPRQFALRQWVHQTRQRLPGPGSLALAAIAAATACAAALVLLCNWPPGGGTAISELAIAQGASLVFVVLLLSLVPGPVEAARTIGWEPTWILRDRITWIGFASLALVSLAELTIAWAKPEHAEEGATILLTASGIAVTGLLARRLLRMSDPATQLRARVEAQIPRLVRLIAKERTRAYERAREQGVDEAQARLLESTPHPGAQSGISGVLKPMFGFAVRALHDGRSDQAQEAHVSIVQVVIAYVEAGRRIALQDKVIEVFADRSSDLHELASGPRGRDLSTVVLNGFSSVGNAIASSHARHGIREGGALHRLGFMADLMAKRRLADESSTDPGLALTVIGEMAALAAQIGDGATAVGIGQPLVALAAPATNARRPHIAGPAWRSAIKVMRVLSLVDAEHRDEAAIDMWAEGVADAIAALDSIPAALTYSGAEPLLQIDPVEPSLAQTWFALWTSDLDGHLKGRLDHRISDALCAPIAATSRDEQPHAAAVVAEVWHQMACAAASGSIAHPDDLDEAVVAMARKLAAMRSLWTFQVTANSVLHAYMTDWIVALYVARDMAALPHALLQELDALGGALPHVAHLYPRGPLAEARAWLVDALRGAGRNDGVVQASAWALSDESPGAFKLAGLMGGRRLHRGLVIAPVVADAEAWWLRSGT